MRLLLFCLAFVFSPAAWGLDPDRPLAELRYDSWEEAEGLPHYSINAVAQGAEGYLWLGTYYGLVQFDGRKFVVFDQKSTPAMKSNRVQCLAASAQGSLFIGTSGGLVEWHRGVFRPVPLQPGGEPSVRSLFLGEGGDLWIGTSQHGAFVLRAGKVTAVSTPDPQVRALYEDRRGWVWFGTNSGLFCYRDGRFVRYGMADGLPDDRVLSIVEDRTGALWIGTGNGLGRRGPLPEDPIVSERRIHGSPVWALREDRDGGLWICMLGGGLARLTERRLEFFQNPKPLASQALTALFQDREGSLWIGASGGGLGRLREVPFRTVTSENGLGGNLVQAVLAARDGSVWVGLNGGGLTQLGAGGRPLATWNTTNGLPSNDIWCLTQDRQGAIWAGHYSGEITRLYRNRLTHYTARDGLPKHAILALTEARDGSLWIATMNGGLAVLRREKIRVYTQRDGMVGDHVRALHEDRAGRLWIGTSRGLSVFENGRFRNLTRADGLAGDFVFSFLEDADGTLWIGSFDGGLTRYRDGKLFGYGRRSGFPTETVFHAADDGRGFLWISSSDGIFRLERRELEEYAAGGAPRVAAVSYGIADGLNSRECNGGQPAAARTADGRLWFPTMKGLAVVDPARLRSNPLPPPVRLEALRAEGREHEVHRAAVLPAGTRNVEFQFTGLSLVAPEKMRFRYRLVPYDREWREGGPERRALYTSFPPGEYTFQVIAANNDGVWNKTGVSLPVTLQPYFSETGPFRALSALLAFTFLWGWHQRRTRRLQGRNAELETRVAERTQSLEAANKEMTALIEDLRAARRVAEEASRARSEFVANVSHEIRTPMNGILGLMGLVLETPLAAEQQSHLQLAQESAETLLHMLNDVLDFSKIDAGRLQVESAPFSPRQVVEDSAAIFAPRAASKGLALRCRCEESLPREVHGDAFRLRQILLNLLGNAVKFTSQGEIVVGAEAGEEAEGGRTLRFFVRDTGIGIPKEKQAVIFEPFRQADSSTTRVYGGTGLGLAISARLVAALGGSMEIESEPGKGSCFRFTITVQAGPARQSRAAAPHAAAPQPIVALRVLLAEDNPINQTVAVHLLRKEGFTVEVAPHGAEAVARTGERDYDLVLMDVQMPGMDGLTATERIRERERTTGRHVPIIALTAHAMAGDRERCLAVGMDAYLAKPIQPAQLREAIQQLLSGSRPVA